MKNQERMEVTDITTKRVPPGRGASLPFLLLLVACLAGAVRASAEPVEDPLTVVRNTADHVLARLAVEQDVIRANPGRVHVLVDEIVVPHFDFQRMSSWVLGKHWRRASEAQRAQFPQEFRTLLVRTYATALSEYTDQRIDYLPLRMQPGDTDVTVRTEIHQGAGPNIPVSYRLHQSGGQWKVYDVVIDGISLVTTYRSTFASHIRQRGLDGLIESLASKNQTLAMAK